MAEISVSEARDSLSEIVNRVAYQGERVVLHRHGKTVAVLVSAADWDRLAALDKDGSSKSSASKQKVRRRTGKVG